MNSNVGLYIAKCGEKDFRFTFSSSVNSIRAYPNQFFQDKQSFKTMEDAVTEGSKSLESVGIIVNEVHFLGDLKYIGKDDWHNNIGDIIQF